MTTKKPQENAKQTPKTTRKKTSKTTARTTKRRGAEAQEKKTAEAKATFLKAYEANLGNVSGAARSAKIERSTYYKWLESDPEFKERARAVTETQKDFAESMLMKLIRDGDGAAIKFYLSTKGRDRGYGEKVEVTGAEGKPLIPNISIQVIDTKEEVQQEEEE